MATMKVGAAPGDWEDEAIQSQLAAAQALRKKGMDAPSGQMIGDWYMPTSPWAILGQTVGGGMLENAARSRQGEIQQGREQAFQDVLRQRPSATMTQTQELAGPTEGGEPLMGTAEVAKPWDQQEREAADYATKLLAIKDPRAQAMGAHAFTRALDLPEKRMTAATAAEERKQARLEKAADQARRDRERAEERREDREDRQSFQSGQNEIYRRTAAQLGAVGGANTDLDRQIKEMRLEQMKKDATKPSAQKQKEESAVDTLLDKIIAAEQGLPHASGAGAVVPAGVRQYFTGPQTIMADSSISSLGAEQAHELYGAAFTKSEQDRAAQFLPVTTGLTPDKTSTLQAKIKTLKILAEKKKARLQGKPDPHPNMYNDILDPISTAPATSGGKTVVREVQLKDGRIGVEYSDGTRGYK